MLDTPFFLVHRTDARYTRAALYGTTRSQPGTQVLALWSQTLQLRQQQPKVHAGLFTSSALF